METSMVLAIIGVSVSGFTAILIALRQNIKKSKCCFGEVDFVSNSSNIPHEQPHEPITPQITPPSKPPQCLNAFPEVPVFVINKI